MQVSKIEHFNNSFNGFLNSKPLLKTLEFASNNGSLFAAGTALALSAFVRPLAILATPKAEKENKEYACAKSIASSLVGFGVMALISAPIIKAVNNIEKSPAKYLSKNAVSAFKNGSGSLKKSAPFRFSSQMFKLSSSFISVIPKAFLTCALIPPVMALFFNNKPDTTSKTSNISFGASVNKNLYSRFSEKISELMGKILNKKTVQDFSKKYSDSNFPQHMFNGADILATAVFAKFTLDNKNIKADRKKTLIWNASIMTGLSVVGGYVINRLLDKPTEMFIAKFKNANKNAPKLDKYLEGIKIAKPALILGGLYYIVAPMVSTICAEMFSNRDDKCKV